MKKTKKEIIEETVAFYEEDQSRRAISDTETCQYRTEDGKMCALGRCFTEDAIEKYGDFQGGIDVLIIDNDLDLDDWENILKEEYRGHAIKFWEDLQQYHDWYQLWNGGNCETKREEYVNRLLDKWVKN